MKTFRNGTNFQTDLTEDDCRALNQIIEQLGQFTTAPPIGAYMAMSIDDIWLALVSQVCVMGSAAPMDRLSADSKKYRHFTRAVSLSAITSRQKPETYLSRTLATFSATRFHNRSAKKITSLLALPSVYYEGELTLLAGLSHAQNVFSIRDTLIDRCPIFKLKSASDFMISLGLSHDVITLDTRIVGLFQRYLDYNFTPEQIQAHTERYLSLESALRGFCQNHHISLALLDRLLFQFTNLSAIEFILRYSGPGVRT